MSADPAGYSGTPLPKKLGIKPGSRVAVLGEPADFGRTLGELPTDVVILRRARAPLDVVVAFFTSRATLERRLPALRAALHPAGGLWIAWPKRTSGLDSDLSEREVRELGLAAGLVDNKICAIDASWSGLRFVYRLRDRPEATGDRRTQKS
jgi:hypothetical protein